MRSAAAGGAERNNKKLHDDVTVTPVMYGNSEAAAASASDATAPLRHDKVMSGGAVGGDVMAVKCCLVALSRYSLAPRNNRQFPKTAP